MGAVQDAVNGRGGRGIQRHPLQGQRKNFRFHPSRFQWEDLPCRRKLWWSQGLERKWEAEAGEERLPSNFLLLNISTEWHPPSTGKGSSQQIGSLECLGYSEPICSSLVKYTQAQMGICWTPPQKDHGGIQTDNVPLVQEIIWSITDKLSYQGFKNWSDS